jgi:hypothetical protein
MFRQSSSPQARKEAMSSKKTTFERIKLFDEVWAIPVTKLAKDYGLSDVGLRKICLALDVPLPPRGYWQKLAAGKKMPKPELRATTIPATHTRMMRVAQVDEVLEERIAQARDAIPDAANSGAPAYTPPLDPKEFSPQTKLVQLSMKGVKLEEGALTSIGVSWADVSVSPDLKERALLLVDRFAHELKALDAIFESTHPPLSLLRRAASRESGSKRNCFSFHGQYFFVRIQERITQELVPPPPPKPLRPGARQPEWKYRPPEYRYIATGKLHATIVGADTYYSSSKIEDTARGTIEDKVKRTVQSVADAALRRKVQTDLQAERELVRRTKAKEWEAAKSTKDQLLAALASFEKMAADLDRARSLRRLMKEIVASQTAPAELVSDLELMALMADWLDPLVKAPWPEVDGVGTSNPYGTLW